MKRQCLPSRNRAGQEIGPQARPVVARVIGLPANAALPAADLAGPADSVLRQSLSRLNKSDSFARGLTRAQNDDLENRALNCQVKTHSFVTGQP